MPLFDVKANVIAGQFVLFAPHPGYEQYQPMLVTMVGDESLTGLVFTNNSAQPRDGVRHETDEIWQDTVRASNLIADNDAGSFVLHPDTIALNEALARLAALEERMLDSGDKPVSVGKKKREVPAPAPLVVEPTKSFREPTASTAPELTPEEKESRRKALDIAMGRA